MKFDMTRPCDDCPFRNDLPKGYLRSDRVREIVKSLFNQRAFPCHKTTVSRETEECDDADDRVVGPDSQACAGSEIFLLKQNKSTQLGRIMERLGLAAKLDVSAPVCGSLKEMLAVHKRK